MGVKRVVAFAENTDYGIGQAKLTGEMLKQKAPQIDYKYETLDRASKDFTAGRAAAARQPARRDRPLDAAAGRLHRDEPGLRAGRRAEREDLILYDGAGLADYPDFWQNVKEAGKYMLAFALYHPQMKQTPLATQITAEYKKRTGGDINRLVLQAADSLELVIQGIEAAKSTDADKLIKAMETMKFDEPARHLEFLDRAGLFVPAVARDPVRELRAHGREAAGRADGADPGTGPEVRPDEDRPPGEVTSRARAGRHPRRRGAPGPPSLKRDRPHAGARPARQRPDLRLLLRADGRRPGDDLRRAEGGELRARRVLHDRRVHLRAGQPEARRLALARAAAARRSPARCSAGWSSGCSCGRSTRATRAGAS